MLDKTSITCRSCNARIELPAQFCAMCGAPIVPPTETADAQRREIAEKDRIVVSELAYDWRIFEILKEWPPEVLTPRATTRQDEKSGGQSTNMGTLWDLVRQVESGNSEILRQVQPREGTSGRSESFPSPDITAKAFAAAIQEEIASAGYPLLCTIGQFKGPHAPPGEAVLIKPEEKESIPLAGEYIYSLSIGTAGKDILLQPRLLRVNQLKKHWFLNILQDVFRTDAWSQEPPPWGRREKVAAFFKDIHQEWCKRAAECAENDRKPPPYLPGAKRDEWHESWQQELEGKASHERDLNELMKKINEPLDKERAAYSNEHAALSKEHDAALSKEEAALSKERAALSKEHDAALSKEEAALNNEHAALSKEEGALNPYAEKYESQNSSVTGSLKASSKLLLWVWLIGAIVTVVSSGSTAGIYGLLLVPLLCLVVVLAMWKISLELRRPSRSGIQSISQKRHSLEQKRNLLVQKRNSLVQRQTGLESSYAEKRKVLESSYTEKCKVLHSSYTEKRKDLEAPYTEKRQQIERQIAEARQRRIQVITEYLSGAWEKEFNGAFRQEQTWFDRAFRDPNLPQVAALADKVYRAACQRWFGKPPTLRLLDYESQT